MTHRVILRMEVFPELAGDFERTWGEVGEAISREPHNLGQTLVRDTEEQGVYWVLTDWTDEPRFRAFETSPAHVEHRQRLRPYRRGGSMNVTELVRHIHPARSTA
ncbi:antibiotic biosynthesis monooxygenase family protein [Streptomyces hirsutus]|uniref:antibiotic biosynthesis monooxygenase family protein n=1 Tax=Streptomyces hirsutus TaxID=35620 RepID=UPI000AACC6F7|nr:antibiotic biosynthesis monooxygenase family protein [Streptomyces hirsutus]